MKKKVIISIIEVIVAIILIAAALRLLMPHNNLTDEMPSEGESHVEEYELAMNDEGEFETIYYAGEINKEIFSVENDGIYKMSLDGSDKVKLCDANASNKIVSDARVIYFIDITNFELMKLDVASHEVESVYSLYSDIDRDVDNGFKNGYIEGAADGYIYFEEWYSDDEYTTYIYNTVDGSCVKNDAYLGNMQSYGDDIYYLDLRSELEYGALYKSKADGSGQEVVKDRVGTFEIFSDVLCYSQSNDDLTEVHSLNIESGEDEILISMRGITVYDINSFMLHYRDSAGADYVYRFNDEEIESVEGFYGIFGNRVIRREESDAGVIFSDTRDSKSATVQNISYAVNYIGGYVWYIDTSGELLSIQLK